MSITATYNKANANIEVSIDGEKVFSAPKAYLHSRGEVSLQKIKSACNDVFNAAPNTYFDIIRDPQRQKNAVFSKLGLF